MFTTKFLQDAAERAIRAMAWAGLGVFTAEGVDLLSINWEGVLTVVGVAGISSVLASIAATNTGDSTSASLIGTTLEKKR